MKKIITNYRYWLMLIVATVGTIGIFSEPVDSLSPFAWLWTLITSKIVGFGAFYFFYRLVEHWEKRNAIPEFTQFTKEF